jgi:hypothetical protein
MKKFAFIPLAAVVALGACNDTTALTAPNELDIKAAAPGTTITGEFTITGSGDDVWVNFPDAPRNVPTGHTNTSCDADGRYTRTAGGSTQTSAPNNERCGEWEEGGEDLNIKLSGIVANFVQPRSGNIHLNFTVCGYYEDEDTGEWIQDCDAKAFVHYHHNHNVTEGSGVVLGIDEDGNEWLVFLGSIGHSGNEQMLAKKLTGVTAQRLDGSIQTQGAELTWE